jgi:hypothetical protein
MPVQQLSQEFAPAATRTERSPIRSLRQGTLGYLNLQIGEALVRPCKNNPADGSVAVPLTYACSEINREQYELQSLENNEHLPGSAKDCRLQLHKPPCQCKLVTEMHFTGALQFCSSMLSASLQERIFKV